jgi:hypothetical protein
MNIRRRPRRDTSELELYKREIDLLAYAQEQGFAIQWARCTPRGNPVHWILKKDETDILALRTPKCWVYRNLDDDSDRGTILDFVQKVRGFRRGYGRSSLGEDAVNELRRYAGQLGPPPAAPPRRAGVGSPALAPAPAGMDRAAVQARFAAAVEASFSHYLERERCLTPKTLTAWRFEGTWRTENRGNILFPHHDLEGLCGFEVKNVAFTVSQGTKGLWHSRTRLGDTRLFFVEGAIDAFSHYRLHPSDDTRYMSTGGNIGAHQRELIRRAITRMPPATEIIAGFDRDKAGDRFTAVLEGLAEGRPVKRELPARGKDWNDLVKLLTREAPQEISR